MNISNESFGGSSNIEVGDVVCWSKFDKKYTGVVSNKLLLSGGGRNVVFGIVFCFQTQETKRILLLNLKKVVKDDEEVVEN